jgi:L-arabinose isomerase
VYTTALGIEEISDFAELTGVELVVVDESTRAGDIRKELRWNEASYAR